MLCLLEIPWFLGFKKQKSVSRSTAEGEFRAMALASCEIVWITCLMSNLQVPISLPTHLYCDNMAALHIANKSVFHDRTKHVDTDCYTIRDHIDEGLIKTLHVRTHDQLADLLTKPLYLALFKNLIGKMGVSSLFTPPS